MKTFTTMSRAFAFVFALVASAALLQAQTIVRVTSPSSLEGTYPCSPAGFGPLVVPNGPTVSAPVVYLGAGEEGCDAISQDLTGNIVIIDRGSCNFSTKVFNAQNAGAVGVIVMILEGDPFGRFLAAGDNADDITIPAVSMLYDDAIGLIQAMNTETVNATIAAQYEFEAFGTPLWSEDFANGLDGWETENTNSSGDTSIWRHQAIPFSSWGSPMVLNSPSSVSNGVASFDAWSYSEDEINAGMALPDYTSTLTSPAIPIGDEDNVLLTFYNANFELNANNFPLPPMQLQFTTDGVNYSDVIEIATENVVTATATNWVGTETQSIVLTGLNGSENFKIRFTFDADLYYWAIDDIAVFAVPEYNPTLVSSFYPLSSEVTPEAHIATDTFGIQAIIRNEGTRSDDPFVVTFEVRDGDGNVIPDATRSVERTVDPFAFDTIIFDRYRPELDEGSYSISYSVTPMTQTDAIDGDNQDDYTFRVSNNKFQKEDAQQADIVRGDSRDQTRWFFGEFFQISAEASELNRTFYGAEMAFTSRNDTAFNGENVTLYLVRWTDDNNGVPDIDEMRVGSEPFAIPTDLAAVEIIAFGAVQLNGVEHELLDLRALDGIWLDNNGTPISLGDIILDGGTTYGIIAELGNEVGIAAVNRENPQGIAGLLYNTQGNGNYFTGVIGLAPIIRLVVQGGNASNEVELADDVARVFPTMTQGAVTLEYNFEESTEADLRVISSDGRIVSQSQLGELAGAGQMSLNLGDQASGVYYIQLDTEQGVMKTPVMIMK